MTAGTNALRLLKLRGIAHEVLEYPVSQDDLSAQSVAAKLGLDPNIVFKTLVAVGDREGPAMFVIPGPAELDFRKAAAASGNKSVSMLPLRELEPLTGYVRGGCSPVGSRKMLPVYVDETAELYERVSVSAGRRGLQMLLAPADLIRAAEATLADLV